MESSLPSGYGQILRVFRQGFSPWAERSTDDTCSNWATGRYNSEEMKATDMRTGQAADHRFKSQGLVCSLELPASKGCGLGNHNFAGCCDAQSLSGQGHNEPIQHVREGGSFRR